MRCVAETAKVPLRVTARSHQETPCRQLTASGLVVLLLEGRALERREAEPGPFRVPGQHEFHRVVAESAAAIVEEQVRRSHGREYHSRDQGPPETPK